MSYPSLLAAVSCLLPVHLNKKRNVKEGRREVIDYWLSLGDRKTKKLIINEYSYLMINKTE